MLIPAQDRAPIHVVVENASLLELVDLESKRDSVSYIVDNCQTALQCRTREELWTYIIETSIDKLKGDAVILEFGVWKGVSVNFFAFKLPHTDIYGFDSFEGLEEDWYGHHRKKGFLNLDGIMPKVHPNVKLIKGWFEETVPAFLETFLNREVAIVHLDADTYKPTAYVLTKINHLLRKGVIVIFDEYFGFSSWRLHEFRAWQEFVKKNNISYRYLAYSNHGQVAIEVL